MENKNLKIAWIAVAAVIVGAVLAVLVPHLIRSGWEVQQVTTQGTYTAKQAPDFAKILINFESLAKTAEEAQQINADQMTAIIAALKSMGLTDDDLKTTNYNIYPEYNWRNEGRELTGYRASHTLEATVADYEHVGKYLDAAVKAGANQIYTVQFELSESNQAKLKTEALKKATQDARTKAEAMADGLGMQVVRAKAVSDSSWDYYPRYYATEMKGADMQDYRAATPIQPGDIETTARVQAVFEIA